MQPYDYFGFTWVFSNMTKKALDLIAAANKFVTGTTKYVKGILQHF